jgi:hypothetical protein
MSPRDTRAAISDIRLERYRLGELPPEERDALAAQVASDPALRERLDALDRSDREVENAHPARVMSASIRQRAAAVQASLEAPAAPRRRWLVPAAILATCACLAALAVSLRQPAAVDDGTTIKGGGTPSIVLHRRVENGSEPLADGAVARQGDQVRIGYRASGGRCGAILSIDGRGAITQHLPRVGSRCVPLQPSGTVFLDSAYELDDAPRWETFYFVTADTPFDIEPVRRAVRAAASGAVPGSLALPRGLLQYRLLLNKDVR